jgi:hypothetical protein
MHLRKAQEMLEPDSVQRSIEIECGIVAGLGTPKLKTGKLNWSTRVVSKTSFIQQE